MNLLISHIKDVDGVSPIILLKLCNIAFEYKLLEISDVDTYIEELLTTNLDRFDNIYITDLLPNDELIKKIDEREDKLKFKMFDHHISRKALDKYDFITINERECATSIFFEYLKKNYIFPSSVDEYVENVLDLDMWYWVEKNNTTAKKLGDLFEIYGIETYVRKMYEKLKNTTSFFLSDFEEEILILEQDRINRYINRKEESMIITKYKDYNVGVVFSDSYRSELGHALSIKYEELDFIMIINPSGGVSLRTEKDNIDLSIIAKGLGGGGHKKAAGIEFTLDMKYRIIDDVLKGSNKDE